MTEHRKLATIMAVDLAGYSRTAEADESKATEAVRRLRAAIDAIVGPLSGRVFSTAGDGFMIELPIASAGVEAARQLLVAPEAPLSRIGLHLGEVIVAENGDLLGHGVNVAARLQAMAEPGSALVSQAVQAQIRSPRVKLVPLGKVQLDKMHERIDVFALSPDSKRRFARVFWRRSRRAVAALTLLAFVAGGGYMVWRSFSPQEAAPSSRLAVLRFETLGDTEPYFTETLADDLIAYASRIPELNVIARASSFRLEGAEATPEGAARELHATLVLTGSVRRIADRVRVAAQLSEAPGGRQLWSEEFERPITEIYLLRDEIAARVALAVGLRASAPTARRVDLRAYETYLRGREAHIRDPEGAAALYEQAVAREPRFAAAWAHLAQSRLTVALRRWEVAPPDTPMHPAWLAPAVAAADRALALDVGDPVPHEVRARAYFYLGRWPDALEATEQAAARGGGASVVYASLGHTRRAMTLARRAVARDPLNSSAWVSLGRWCMHLQDLRCAIEALERHRHLQSDYPPDILASALHRAGRSEEALALTRQQEEAWREFFSSTMSAPLDMQLMRSTLGEGRPPSTGQLLATLQRGAHVDNLIIVFADLNRGEDASRLLPHWTAGARPRMFLLFDYRLAPMRARPEFWSLMEREGIAQLWRESGEWPVFCEREPVCERYLRNE